MKLEIANKKLNALAKIGASIGNPIPKRIKEKLMEKERTEYYKNILAENPCANCDCIGICNAEM